MSRMTMRECRTMRAAILALLAFLPACPFFIFGGPGGSSGTAVTIGDGDGDGDNDPVCYDWQPGDDRCRICMTDNCCEDFNDCQTNEGCVAVLRCTQACRAAGGTDLDKSSCELDCDVEHPIQAVSMKNSYERCGENNCFLSCDY